VLKILRWLDKQTEGKTYKEIERAGEPTIKAMLEKGVVVSCGTDDEGLAMVRISSHGRDQVKIAERWARKRAARKGRP
jgi:hypothetical protein